MQLPISSVYPYPHYPSPHPYTPGTLPRPALPNPQFTAPCLALFPFPFSPEPTVPGRWVRPPLQQRRHAAGVPPHGRQVQRPGGLRAEALGGKQRQAGVAGDAALPRRDLEAARQRLRAGEGARKRADRFVGNAGDAMRGSLYSCRLTLLAVPQLLAPPNTWIAMHHVPCARSGRCGLQQAAALAPLLGQ